MKQKTTKWEKSTLIAALMMLSCLFSFNAKAQQQAYAQPKDTLLVIKTSVSTDSVYVTRKFQVPTGVTKMTFQCWGAGAAGAYCPTSNICGAGGGGGAYARVEEMDVTPGEWLTIRIGVGGTANGTAPHREGGNTAILRGSTVLLLAAGAPALVDNQITAGTGGAASSCVCSITNFVAFSGGNGGNGMEKIVGVGGGAGGGGAAGSAGAGGNGEDGHGTYGRGGGSPGTCSAQYYGSSVPGTGGDGDAVSWGYGAHGSDGGNYGAGGAGSCGDLYNPGYYHGGKGANGAVVITYDDCSALAGEIALGSSGCYKTLVNSVSATGAVQSYIWQKSENNVEWFDIPGATGDSYTPSDTAYYRRGCITRCGERIYTTSCYVAIGFPTPGFVALTSNSDITSLTECKESEVNISLSMYSCSVPNVKWQKSVDYGTTWTDLGVYQSSNAPMLINEPSLVQETWYRAVYEAAASCEVPTSNVFTLKWEEGVIARPDFYFDNTDVNIVLRYGDKDTVPYIYTPYYEPKGSIVLTNDKGGSVNEGRLLGRVDTGVYVINWILKDCGSPRTYAKRYIVSYPTCGNEMKTYDYDANQYNTVRVAHNCWTKENLKSIHYFTGDSIEGSFVYNSTMYPDSAENLATYGRLYTWYATVNLPENSTSEPGVNKFGHVQGICPQGWFVPTPAMMSQLNTIHSKDLRTTSLWMDGEGTNLSGMSIKPAGFFNGENDRFESLRGEAYFWTSYEVISSKSIAFMVDCNCYETQRVEYDKNNALSVRCVKENEEVLPTVLLFQPTQNSTTSANLSGDVVDGGGLPILESGFCYSTDPMPEHNDGYSTDLPCATPGIGHFENVATGLTTGVTYYVRSYAKTAAGIAYGEQRTFMLSAVLDTITFDNNGGSGTMSKQLVSRGVSTPLNHCVLTYPLSTFKGWSTTPTGEVEYLDRANITTAGNVKLYAQWYHPTHTATTVIECGSYTWNGTKYTTSGTYTYSHADVHGCTQVDTLHLTINPTYTFTETQEKTLAHGVYYEWRGKHCYTTGTYYDSLTTVCCGCDSVYVLNLTVNIPTIDYVSFDNNGGEGTMTTQSFTRGIAQNLKANTFTYPLSVFKNWNTQANGSGTTYTDGQLITTTASMTLYAQWYHPSHQSTTVTECGSYTWTAGTGATYTTSGTHTYTHIDAHGCTQVDTLHLTIYPVFSYTETYSTSASYTPYVWRGRNLMTSGVYYDSLLTIHNCDSVYKLTLTVTDSIKKTVTFSSNGGSGTMNKQKININMPTPLNPNTLTKNGYRFDGWSTNAAGTGTRYADGALITLTGDVVLYAQWGSWCNGTPRAANEAGNGRVDSVKDHQNNWYEVVQIGTQCWLRENMRATTSPTTGSTILLPSMKKNTFSKAASYYNNSTSNKKYGVLYNWCAAMDTYKSGSPEVATSKNDTTWNPSVTFPHQGICPVGWHLPTAAEWKTMADYVGVGINSGEGLGKLCTGNDWGSYSSGSYPGNTSYQYRNVSGFSALNGGFYCDYNSGNGFAKHCTHMWVGDNTVNIRCFGKSSKYLLIERGSSDDMVRSDASYVRCVRDAE